MSKDEQCQSRFFLFNHFHDSPKRVLSSFGLSREFSFMFFFFSNSRKPLSARRRANAAKSKFSSLCFLFFKIPIVQSQFPVFQSSSPVATNAKSYSVFLLKSARNCPPSKTTKSSKFCRYRKVAKSSRSGQFVKDFLANKSVFFFFYYRP